MTAQKLTKSSSTNSFKTFKQALQQKVHSRQIEFHRREREAVANNQQKAVMDAAPAARNQVWGNGNDPTPRVAQPGGEVPAAATTRTRPATVEPELSDRHLSAMVVTTGHTAAADGEVLPAAALPLVAGAGAAIPMSPPSSPTHVTSQHDVTVPEAGAPEEVVPSTHNAIVEVKQSPSGGGEGSPAPAGLEMPPPPLPAPALARASAAAEIKDGDDAESATSSGVKPESAAATPVPPVRLGRGRKLCPNCNALTKSAVKQCRECKHFFSPASSRLRPPTREPKENDEDTMPARRRLRPSQRLIEYELYEAGSQAAGGGEVDSSSRSARRPLANFSTANAGGGANHRMVAGGGGGGRPAPADAGGVTKKSVAAGGGGGGGARSATDGTAQPPKRSHKRKIPLPPGVAPPKRRKGAAAAARAQAIAAQAAHGSAMQPSTLPCRQRVAQNLSAAHVRVPTSPELGPSATPAGPLLFMSSAASLSPMEDDADVWPPAAPSSQQQEQPAAVSVSASVATTASLAFDPLSLSPPREQPLQPRSLYAVVPPAMDIFAGVSGGGGNPAADLLLMDDSKPKERDYVIDLSVESQGKDPFEGVELWLEDGSSGDGCVSSTLSPADVAGGGVQTALPTAVGGEAVEQRVFSLDESLELLDDADLMWGPVRSSSANDNNNGVATSLWPEAGHGGVSSSSRRSPPPGSSHALLNFERGAALASAVALGSCRNGGGAEAETGGCGDIDLQGLLLGESDSNLSFDIMRGETGMSSAAACTNSGNKGDNVFWFSGAPRGGGSGSRAGGATSVVALSPSSVPRTVAS